MKPRTLLFWIHLVIGVTTLLFIFIMSATGVLLAYQRQILEWYDTHDYRAAPPSPGTPHLRPDRIVAAVRVERPDAAISSVTFHADPSVPAEVGVGRRTLFVNPYSGQVSVATFLRGAGSQRAPVESAGGECHVSAWLGQDSPLAVRL